MKTIKIRSQQLDDETEIRLLISHPMENGRNRDPGNGELIPAHFIEQLNILLNDKIVINLNMAGSIAKNPFFSFRLKNLSSGDKISAEWFDNLQLSDRTDYLLE